jgi:hypothetical protein
LAKTRVQEAVDEEEEGISDAIPMAEELWRELPTDLVGLGDPMGIESEE